MCHGNKSTEVCPYYHFIALLNILHVLIKFYKSVVSYEQPYFFEKIVSHQVPHFHGTRFKYDERLTLPINVYKNKMPEIIFISGYSILEPVAC